MNSAKKTPRIHNAQQQQRGAFYFTSLWRCAARMRRKLVFNFDLSSWVKEKGSFVDEDARFYEWTWKIKDFISPAREITILRTLIEAMDDFTEKCYGDLEWRHVALLP
jgi:hypothetical protein